MSFRIESARQFSRIRHTPLSRVARPAILRLQNNLRLFPRQLCLITGAPRSGTSALCEWLGLQPGVSAFSESRILVSAHHFMEEICRFRNLENDSEMIFGMARNLVADYYSNARILIGKRLILDKEPLEPTAFPSKGYRQFIGNVRRLFPESKLLFAIRDPIATVWSMSRRTWGSSLTNIEPRRSTVEEHTENWCSCADLILQYCSDPEAYIVQFGRLVRDPEIESRRVLDFLNIPNGNSFQPKQTKETGFSDAEKEKILSMVQPQLELLNAQGLSDLS